MPVNDDLAQLIKALPQLAESMPAAGAADPYAAALAEFDATPGTLREPLVGGRRVADYIESETGKLMLDNGVIVDQVTGEVIPGPWMADPEIEGSSAWLRSIQDKWSDSEFNTWRKRLVDLGYDTLVSGGIATKGGMAADVLEGLRQYHYQRYLNGGKPLRVAPKSSDREAIRKSFDVEAIKERVGTWLDAAGIDRDDDVQTFLAHENLKLATELARKHPDWTMQQVEQGAELRSQKEFVKNPGVKHELQSMEEDEMDNSLLDEMSSIMEMGAI